jgi:hypothetical protein
MGFNNVVGSSDYKLYRKITGQSVKKELEITLKEEVDIIPIYAWIYYGKETISSDKISRILT